MTYPIASNYRNRVLTVSGIGQNQVVLTTVADGDRGTRQTIQYARQLVREGLRDPRIHEMALAFCSDYGAESFDELAELRSVFQGVLDNFYYRKHIIGAQSLQPVSGLLRTRSGDCAELNLVLLPSLLGCIGYPTRAVVVKADPQRPDEFSHVYIEAMTEDGVWIPLDVAREGAQFGRAPERYWAREVFNLTPDEGGRTMNGYAHGAGAWGLGAAARQNPWRGMGAARRKFSRRGLGQDPSEMGLASQTIATAPALLQGIAQVVQASNMPASAYQPVAASSGVTVSANSGIYVVLALAGVAAVALAMGKH